MNTEGYRDYRGVEVVGAWAWLPRHGFGLTSEIDNAEAFGSALILQRAFDGIIALLALLALGMRRAPARLVSAQTHLSDAFDSYKLAANHILKEDEKQQANGLFISGND